MRDTKEARKQRIKEQEKQREKEMLMMRQEVQAFLAKKQSEADEACRQLFETRAQGNRREQLCDGGESGAAEKEKEMKKRKQACRRVETCVKSFEEVYEAEKRRQQEREERKKIFQEERRERLREEQKRKSEMKRTSEQSQAAAAVPRLVFDIMEGVEEDKSERKQKCKRKNVKKLHRKLQCGTVASKQEKTKHIVLKEGEYVRVYRKECAQDEGTLWVEEGPTVLILDVKKETIVDGPHMRVSFFCSSLEFQQW